MGHDHSSPHAHGHHHGAAHPGGSAHALRAAFLLNAVFTVIEAVGGWWSQSIAVLTDSLHDLGDCLVLGLAWYLQRLSVRGRTGAYSYGHGRYAMLGGWASAWVLIAGSVLVVTGAVPRLLNPVMPHTGGMLLIAMLGLVMNGIAAWRLHGGGTLNEQGAYLHLLEDVLGWAAVLVGAVVIRLTGWSVVDPLLSIAIATFILWNASGTLRRGTAILMQRDPEGIDPASVRAALLAIPMVRGVHDQHAWSLDGTYTVLTVHLVVDSGDLGEVLRVKEQARHALHALGVQHATIETERPGEPCELLHH